MISVTTLAGAPDGHTDAGIEYGSVPSPATATFGDVMQADDGGTDVRRELTRARGSWHYGADGWMRTWNAGLVDNGTS